MITGKNYIGFSLSAKGDTQYQTFNPKENKENNTKFFEATSEEIDAAVNLASQAFIHFRNTSGPQRSKFLNAIADEILALDDLLIETYVSESGLPQGRAMGERGRTIAQLKMFAELVASDNWRQPTIDDGQLDRTPAPKPDIRQLLIPLGPVVVFGASNFPLAFSTAGGDSASALAAGCPVIVKSHPMHSGTGELVAGAITKAAKETGMPEGVFSNLNSSSINVGQQLVKHPLVKAVGFTGSIKGGRALYNLAANRNEPIPVFAEMGSINPVVITSEAIEKRGSDIASTYANSITLGAGQFCTNPGLLLTIENPSLDAFIIELGAKTAAIESQCMLHPNIQKNFEESASAFLKASETNLVSEHETDTPTNFAKARIVQIAGSDFIKNKNLHEEVFGPLSLVVRCKDEAQLLSAIDSLEGQLTATILAEENEISNLKSIVQSLQAKVGRLVFNGVPTGVEICDAMTHGGPYPASTDSRFTAVGSQAIKRWVRPFSYQDFPEELLPQILIN